MLRRFSLLAFAKEWTLPIAIGWGVLSYLVFSSCSFFNVVRPYAWHMVSVIQPLLIFTMLFLSFCKIDYHALRPRRMHAWMLLVQCSLFALLTWLLYDFPSLFGRVWIEGAMLCLICPTATAAAVVTQKLQGDAADVTMYTILINLSAAVLVPLAIPLIHPSEGQGFMTSFVLILSKVFPMLICPLLAALLVRYFFPRLHKLLAASRDLAFYLWAVALSIAMAVTTRSIAHSLCSTSDLVALALVSLVCCMLQFLVGRKIGKYYGRTISGSQGLGQKNTVFGIWLGYTFFNPVTSLAGGFYCIWHNLYNTWQMHQMNRHPKQF